MRQVWQPLRPHPGRPYVLQPDDADGQVDEMLCAPQPSLRVVVALAAICWKVLTVQLLRPCMLAPCPQLRSC